MAEVAAIEDEGILQVLTVYIDNHVFGIPILEIQDVLQVRDLTRVPLSAPHIVGVMNLRGRIVTAISLRKGISANDTSECQDNMNVVIESGNELYSVLVDRVGDVLALDKGLIEEPPLTLDESWREVTTGVHQLNDSIMIILDTEKIIHPEER